MVGTSFEIFIQVPRRRCRESFDANGDGAFWKGEMKYAMKISLFLFL